MTYRKYLDGEPVIVTAALTGGIHGKEANPNLPERPEEIATAAAACEAAGASVVHLHARRKNGERAFDPDRFQALTDAVRDRTNDVIVQHSTGGTAAPLQRRRAALRTDPAPDMASLDMGPVNRYDHLTSENTRATIDAPAEEMIDRGIKPECEAFNPGHINEIRELLGRRDIDPPVPVSVLFGGGTTTVPRPRNLINALDNLPEAARPNVIAVGRHQLPLTTMGIILGCNVRVGLEDNVYYRDEQPAESNAQLVERTVGIARRLERPVATPAEARERLGLNG